MRRSIMPLRCKRRAAEIVVQGTFSAPIQSCPEKRNRDAYTHHDPNFTLYCRSGVATDFKGITAQIEKLLVTR
jgi:hypothetical protein